MLSEPLQTTEPSVEIRSWLIGFFTPAVIDLDSAALAGLYRVSSDSFQAPD